VIPSLYALLHKNSRSNLQFVKRLVLFTAILWPAFWTEAADLKPISLQEALEYARAHHPRIKSAQIGVKIDKEGVTQARSGLFPEISFNALETTGFPSSTGGLGVRGLANSPYKRGWGVDVEVEQTLFDFGRTWALIRAARADENHAHAFKNTVEWDVVVELHRSYASAQMMRDRTSLYESAVGDIKMVLQEVEKLVKTGQRSPVESA
jgi:outer membrane protein TolC